MRASDYDPHKNPHIDMRIPRPAVVVVYVRHKSNCPHREDESYPRCQCPKALRWSRLGTQYRRTAATRSWRIAEEKAEELRKKIEAGEAGIVLPAASAKQATIAAALETFIQAKEGEGCSSATIRKLRNQIGDLERFLAERSKFFPAEITTTDLIEFRAGWTWQSGVTRQKAQQNVRAFLRSCCKENLTDLLAALKTIRLSKVDLTRLEPQPFSEAELKNLLGQVPKTFPNDPTKAARMTALIHLQVSTGLAIRDAVQLERENIKGGWLRIKRQKTGKPVEQKLDGGLHRELTAVANGNTKYIFWNGTSRPTSATGLWQEDLRTVMKAAGLWIKGNLSHRFRDTAVDFWLGQGCSIVEVSAMLGDTVSIVERHYRKLLSGRMAERLAKVPTRTWA
jgi:site-specific recombinase XerD